ncbi:MAG: UxaA family hydrolase [Tissierellaceae bacterium]|nr:UxaA family hydrolase [Tissierellaceae bacterium]
MTSILGLKVNEKDNVAVVFSEEAKIGVDLFVRDHKGDIQVIKLKSDIPYGHKVAVKPIKTGDPIFKYGEEIGVATINIETGEHTHVHNLDSQRSRGDKN